ncbi:MAG: fumarylacetoacetate hydrolase family protein [Deltaproteobacteria bacterium]|nr:fumarylacetoacetate hydrolase family protein [Deltaproteobacteria bacterium]
MRVARIEKNGKTAWARLLDGARARLLSAAPWDGGEEVGDELGWSPADLRAPVAPSKIVCIGRNYAAHAKELGNEVPKEPLMFWKPPSSIIGPDGSVVLRTESEKVEHEGELGVVIGKRCSRVSPADALRFVYGYTCVNDVTARDLQKKDGQWSRAKGFDTFCPVGPWIETDLDPRDISVRCLVDGVVRQEGRTSQMMFDVAALVSYVSRAFTLEPGDLLATGTPEGVGPLVAGNRVTVAIEGIGELTVGVLPAVP